MFNLTVDDEIHLRNIHPNDSEALFALIDRNRERLRPWIHPKSLPETAKATRAFAVRALFAYYGDQTGPSELDPYYQELEYFFPSAYRWLDLGIWYRGELAGTVLMARLSDSATALEFGYWLTEEHQGKGIITRCIRALMDYAIDNMGILRFVIECAVNNERSIAIPKRLGYRLHVTKPKGEVVGEFVYDLAIYGIRSSDYRKMVKG